MTVEPGATDFKLTMAGLERGLQVAHITTPTDQLRCCQHDEEIEVALNRPDLLQFDQIPVQEQGMIIGLVRKLTIPSGAKGQAKKYMQPLGESILVSADAPLLEFILNNSLERLVIQGTKIYGLVTRSDLLKLPVTLLGFALVTHVETELLTMLHATGISEQKWLGYLSGKRKEEIGKKYRQLKDKRADPDPLELTYFSDKIIIMERLADEEPQIAGLPDKETIGQLKAIKQLRNTIVHTGKDDNADTIEQLIDRLRFTRAWIERWQRE